MEDLNRLDHLVIATFAANLIGYLIATTRDDYPDEVRPPPHDLHTIQQFYAMMEGDAFPGTQAEKCFKRFVKQVRTESAMVSYSQIRDRGVELAEAIATTRVQNLDFQQKLIRGLNEVLTGTNGRIQIDSLTGRLVFQHSDNPVPSSTTSFGFVRPGMM